MSDAVLMSSSSIVKRGAARLGAPYPLAIILTGQGILLVVAAGLKLMAMAGAPQSRTIRNLSLLVVELELILGIWLISGVHRRRAAQVALLCFSAFALASLYKAVTHEPSCGCFGPLEINPWITACFDVFMVATLGFLAPRSAGASPNMPSTRRVTAFLLIALVACSGAAYAVVSRTPRILSTANSSASTSIGPVMLDPQAWLSKPFPLYEQIDVGQQLSRSRGASLIVLYHADCPVCQRAIARFASDNNATDGTPIAFIEVPPYSEDGSVLAMMGSSAISGQLSSAHEWVVKTPLLMVINDGIVRDFAQGERVLQMRFNRALGTLASD